MKASLHSTVGWPGPLTHRQSRAWEAWFALDRERPSRDNWYAMQVAAEVRLIRRVICSDKDPVAVADFRLEFKPAQESPQQQPKRDGMTAEQAAAIAKKRWAGLLGRNPDEKSGQRPARQG